MTTEWVVHCIGRDRILPSNDLEIFRFSELVRNVYENESHERYVVGDIVHFELEPCDQTQKKNQNLQIGKIISFSDEMTLTTNRNPPQLEVQVQLLSITSQSFQVSSSSQNIESSKYQRRQLDFDDLKPEILLSSDRLRHHPVVLTSKAYKQLSASSYLRSDTNVYTPSKSWER